jgi:hypothetical protein
VIHPAIQLGVELNGLPAACKKEGVEVVFNKTYPFGSSDLAAAVARGDGPRIPTPSLLSAIRPTPS